MAGTNIYRSKHTMRSTKNGRLLTRYTVPIDGARLSSLLSSTSRTQPWTVQYLQLLLYPSQALIAPNARQQFAQIVGPTNTPEHALSLILIPWSRTISVVGVISDARDVAPALGRLMAAFTWSADVVFIFAGCA